MNIWNIIILWHSFIFSIAVSSALAFFFTSNMHAFYFNISKVIWCDTFISMEFHATNNRRSWSREGKIDSHDFSHSTVRTPIKPCHAPTKNFYSFYYYNIKQLKLYHFIIFKWNNNGIEIVKSSKTQRKKMANETFVSLELQWMYKI